MFKRTCLLVSTALLAAACGADGEDDAGSTDEALRAANTLTCTSVARALEDASLAPRFTMTAQVAKEYRTGVELTGLTNVRASAGRVNSAAKDFASVAKDAAYKPRGNKNRNRFAIESLDATDESFDGIVHSVILPKSLGPADIDSQDEGGLIVFHAVVASSTDSYHDGIISYFKIRCELSAGEQYNLLSCNSREAPDGMVMGPSFTFTATVPQNFAAGGGELTALTNISASVAQLEPTRWNTVKSDPNYSPRTDLNRNRFNFPASLLATDDQFDGIAHGLILPKTITRGSRSFKGYVISSTDSYHDGIMSYFPMDCALGR